MRIRISVPAASAGNTKVVSEKFISLAIDCIVSRGQAATVQIHRELIPAEQMVGEDVVVKVAV